MLTRGDKVLLAAVVGVALLGLLVVHGLRPAAGNRHVVIQVNGQVYKKLPLSGIETQITVTVPGGYNIVEISGGRVRVRDADCPDKLCVATGRIAAPPQQIVCLPHRVVVKVVTEAADVDDITR